MKENDLQQLQQMQENLLRQQQALQQQIQMLQQQQQVPSSTPAPLIHHQYQNNTSSGPNQGTKRNWDRSFSTPESNPSKRPAPNPRTSRPTSRPALTEEKTCGRTDKLARHKFHTFCRRHGVIEPYISVVNEGSSHSPWFVVYSFAPIQRTPPVWGVGRAKTKKVAETLSFMDVFDQLVEIRYDIHRTPKHPPIHPPGMDNAVAGAQEALPSRGIKIGEIKQYLRRFCERTGQAMPQAQWSSSGPSHCSTHVAEFRVSSGAGGGVVVGRGEARTKKNAEIAGLNNLVENLKSLNSGQSNSSHGAGGGSEGSSSVPSYPSQDFPSDHQDQQPPVHQRLAPSYGSHSQAPRTVSSNPPPASESSPHHTPHHTSNHGPHHHDPNHAPHHAPHHGPNHASHSSGASHPPQQPPSRHQLPHHRPHQPPAQQLPQSSYQSSHHPSHPSPHQLSHQSSHHPPPHAHLSNNQVSHASLSQPPAGDQERSSLPPGKRWPRPVRGVWTSDEAVALLPLLHKRSQQFPSPKISVSSSGPSHDVTFYASVSADLGPPFGVLSGTGEAKKKKAAEAEAAISLCRNAEATNSTVIQEARNFLYDVPAASNLVELFIPRDVQRSIHEAMEMRVGTAAHPSQFHPPSYNTPVVPYGSEPTSSSDITPPPVEILNEISRRLKTKQERWWATPQFAEIQKTQEALPIAPVRNSILDHIATHRVVVVCGETGSGKSTQLPQFVLDEAIQQYRGGDTNIIVTQPRRIAAISLAKRVAQERGDVVGAMGASVGYHVRLDRKLPRPRGGITYCTTGMLLRRLTLRGWDSVSHVIVDEVHERDLNTDFLLILLKDLVQKQSNVRVILMSATANAELFSRWFGSCPVLNVPGRLFPVKEIFVQELTSLLGNASTESGMNQLDGPVTVSQCVNAIVHDTPLHSQASSAWRADEQDGIDGDETAESSVPLELAEIIISYLVRTAAPGAILVFLAGWEDIRNLRQRLECIPDVSQKSAIFSLHSSLSASEQQLVFDPVPAGTRKIVLATNIAETSVTINDVVYVVDTGKHKVKSFDPRTNMSCLSLEWVSKSNATQRAGRAGRVQPGQCYRLYTEEKLQSLPIHNTPEMLRLSLESVCLQAKALGVENLKHFLGRALEAPSIERTETAIARLRQLAALGPRDELTVIGRHLAALPLDPAVGKMLLLSTVFGCVDRMLNLAALMSVRDPFVMPPTPQARRQVLRLKLDFSRGTRSDHITLMNVYEAWLARREQGPGAVESFCQEHFLSNAILATVHGVKLQLYESLLSTGLLTQDYMGIKSGRYGGNESVTPDFFMSADPAPEELVSLCAPGGPSSSYSPSPSPPVQSAPHAPGALYPSSQPPSSNYPVEHSSQSAYGYASGSAYSSSHTYPAPHAGPHGHGHSQWRQPAEHISANQYGGHMELLKAMLCSGVYPNVAQHLEKQSYRTQMEHRVLMHPSSINKKNKEATRPWFVFAEKVNAKRVYIRTTTQVSPFSILLFGGPEIQTVRSLRTVTLDGWMAFRAEHYVIPMLCDLRAHVDKLLVEKMASPASDATHAQNALVHAVSRLLTVQLRSPSIS